MMMFYFLYIFFTKIACTSSVKCLHLDPATMLGPEVPHANMENDINVNLNIHL